MRCFNQMKRIGLAFNIHAGDHEGSPQHTEDYQETRDIDEEGFDTNRIRILSVALKNELLRWDLTCPADEMLGSASTETAWIKTSAIDCAPAIW